VGGQVAQSRSSGRKRETVIKTPKLPRYGDTVTDLPGRKARIADTDYGISNGTAINGLVHAW
jgi:hypothetical protein